MLQVEITLNYLVTNIFMSTKLFQILIKGHILDILNSKSLTGLSPIMILTMVNGIDYSLDKQPPLQLLLSLYQGQISKE